MESCEELSFAAINRILELRDTVVDHAEWAESCAASAPAGYTMGVYQGRAYAMQELTETIDRNFTELEYKLWLRDRQTSTESDVNPVVVTETENKL